MKKILVLASGGKSPGEGGSGFMKLVEMSKEGMLRAKIVVVVSNYSIGGIYTKAKENGIDFEYMTAEFSEIKYLRLIRKYEPDLVCLSGWLKHVKGIPANLCINIHPGPTRGYGGKGMHGMAVHKKIWEDFQAGKIKRTCLTMHYVTPEYDAGPIIFQFPIELEKDDTPGSIQKKVNKQEQIWQRQVTDLVVNGDIFWDGKEIDSVVFPDKYDYGKEIDLN